MRNLKKVLAVIVVVTMIFSTMAVSVFAADEATAAPKTDGAICADLGLLQGGSNGVDDQYLATPTQRIQAAIVFLRILGLEDEAKAFDGTDNFSDVAEVADIPGASNILAYLKANPDLGWSGDGVKFGPTDDLSPQQLYKVLLTLLGYEQGADFDYAETLYFAKFVGMSKIASLVQVQNANLATAILEALACSFKGGGPEQTLISKLVNDGLVKEDAAVAAGFDVSVLHIVSVEAVPAKTVVFGADAGLPATLKATLSDGSTVDVDVAWDAVDTKVAGKVTVKGAVEGFADGVTCEVTVAVQEFVVSGLSSANLKEITVAFSKEVDKDTAETAANYTLNGGLTVSKAVKDGSNVLLTITTSAAQQQSVDVTVKNVKSAVGETIADTTKTISMFDTTVPAFTAVTVTGPKTVKVAFSEPMQTAPSFKVDSGNYYVQNDFAAGAKEVNLTFGVELSAASHSITIKDGTDYAGFKIAETSIAYTYAKDTTVPTVTVKSANETTVTLTFSKPVKPAVGALNNDVTAYFSYNNDAAYKGVLAASSPDANGFATEYTATFATPIPSGANTLYLNTKADKLEDTWGNDVASASLAISVTIDNVKPTVTKVEPDGDKKLKVTFSKDVMSQDAQNKSYYTLKNAAGTVLKNADFADVDDNGHFNGNVGIVYASKVATITFTTPLSGDYVLTIEKVRDTAYIKNTMDAASIAVKVGDKTAPTLSSATINSDFKKIRVYFSEAMDTTGLTTAGNYRLVVNGAASVALPDNSTVSIVNTKTVEISMPAAVANLEGAGGDAVQASGLLKDVAGNAIGGFFAEVAVGTDSINLVAASAEKISKNTITFKVDKELSAIDASLFTSVNTPNRTVASAYYVNDSGKATVTVIFNGDMATDIYDFTSLTIGANALTNVFGTKNGALVINQAALADKTAPTVLGVYTITTTSIEVDFSEAMKLSSLSKLTFTVAGNEITDMPTLLLFDTDGDLANEVVGVRYTLKNAINGGDKPALTQALAVEDEAGNVLAAGTSVVATTDDIAPALSSVTLNAYSGTANSTVTVKFTEAVKDSTIDMTGPVYSDFVFGGTKGITNANIASVTTGDYADDDTIVITLDQQVTLGAGETITFGLSGAGVITDMNDVAN